MSIERIIDSLSGAQDARIIVFGDYALDKYLYSDPGRDEASVETGMSAFQVHRKYLSAGVGGTITNNLRALGAQVICIGIIGEDGEGFELMRELERSGADVSYMVREPSMCTCTYNKPMRGTDEGGYREYHRLDFRNFTPPPDETQRKLLANLEAALDQADAVIVTDQFFQRNLSAVTDYIRTELGRLAARRPDKLFYADSRSFAGEYKNMMVKCNNLELFSGFDGGEGDAGDLSAIVEKGKEICARNGRPFFVTRGADGMVTFDETEVNVIPAFHVDGEVDIVGAGDATNAGIVLGLSLGLTTREAAILGCCVASITIQQIGTTGTASPVQVIERLKTTATDAA